MSAKIDCPLCGKLISNRLEEYAEHILTEHSDNLEWCAWANGELAKAGKPGNDNKPKFMSKFMGKDVDHIPPKRQKKLPGYLRRQL